ncbi:MAG TPA: hypothetical protein VI541_05675, partial [Actinomycetota bacterium]|nr:hypothetical protein [Actinomycetota bacterium]
NHTRVKRFVVALVMSLGVATGMPATASVTTTTETAQYVAGAGDFVVVCANQLTSGQAPGVGGACFDLNGSETTATVTVNDASGRAVGGFWGVDSDNAAGWAFCGSAVIPLSYPGATRLEIYVEEAFSSIDCPAPGAGTKGTISVVLESPDP